MDGSRTIGGLRRFAVLFLTAAIMAGGLIGVGATSSSAADPVATPYIFAPPSTVVGEASGSVTLPVTLSAPGTSTVTVNYSVPGGGCNNLNQGSSGTLTFTPGVVSRNVTVTINNCNVKGKAFFTLTLSSAVNGIIAQATTQVDIVGDNNLQATPGLYVKDAVADT
ncbi:MAG: Calx-beta domain-containing protein, partial [Acidimicrobiia bacterium]